MYRFFGKRAIDFIGSVILLIILFPVLLVIGIAIKIDTRGGIFYQQDRLGRRGKVFRIVKFRTMIPNAESIGMGLYTDGNDDRITHVGRFLRVMSLDELPQLVNIICGEMSFVGPRPPVPYYPFKYSDYPDNYKVRFRYRPGITGWAQINGRANITWKRRFEFDIEYNKRFSLGFDILIILKTIIKVFNKESIYPEDTEIRNEDFSK